MSIFLPNDKLVDDYTYEMKTRSLIPYYIKNREYCDIRLNELRKKLKEVKPSPFRREETASYHDLMTYFNIQRAKYNCFIQDYRIVTVDDFINYKDSIQEFINRHNLPYTVHQLLRTSSIKKNVKPEHHKHFSVFVEQMRELTNVNSKCTIA